MATTGANGVVGTGSTGVLVGSAVLTPPFVGALGPTSAINQTGTVIDRVIVDAAKTSKTMTSGETILPFGDVIGGFALNGWGRITLVTTGTANIDLTDITLAADTRFVTGGDTTFAKIGAIVLKNRSATDLTIIPGASNPASFPKFAGTTPSLTIPAAVSGEPGILILKNPTLVTVDATHKILTITPTSGGIIDFWIGGA